MSDHQAKTVAIILSGGEGQRVDCADKGLLEYQGKQLIAWTIDALQNQVDELIISCNRNLEAYRKLQHPIVQDDIIGQGPIAGILAVCKQLNLSKQDYVLICPCDTALLPTNLVAQLKSGALANNTNIAVVHDGERQHNLHCLIKVVALASLSTFFVDGGRAIKHWFKQQSHCLVDFSDQADCFKNFNTLLEFQKS